MGVATWSGSMLEWGAELSALKERIGSVLSRKELRRSAFIDRKSNMLI